MTELKIMCWNIRKGLITRELELKLLLSSEKIDIIFLTETDTRTVPTAMDYQIEGYTTILPKMSENNNLIRILCLIKNELMDQINVVEALMSTEFPSIWVEYRNLKEAKYIIIIIII